MFSLFKFYKYIFKQITVNLMHLFLIDVMGNGELQAIISALYNLNVHQILSCTNSTMPYFYKKK